MKHPLHILADHPPDKRVADVREAPDVQGEPLGRLAQGAVL